MKQLFTLVFIIFSITNPSVVAAQAANTITVEPASLNFELTAEKPELSSIITLTNQYDTEVNLTAQFKGIETDTGRIVPNGEIDGGLANSLRLSRTEFTIPPHSKYFLTVDVKDSELLGGGGHYAALVFSNNSEISNGSAITTQLSVGLFLVKKQGEIAKIELVKHDFSKKSFQLPSSADVEFLNDGNLHLTPRGYLRIYDKNQVFYEVILNSQSKIILPTKRFGQKLEVGKIDAGLFPKKITTELGYRADGINETRLYTEHFWYIPKVYFVVCATLLGVVVYVSILKRGQIKKLFRNKPTALTP